MKQLIALTLLTATLAHAAEGDEDPYLWLEEVEGAEALDWVREQNDGTFEALTGNTLFNSLYGRYNTSFRPIDK